MDEGSRLEVTATLFINIPLHPTQAAVRTQFLLFTQTNSPLACDRPLLSPGETLILVAFPKYSVNSNTGVRSVDWSYFTINGGNMENKKCPDLESLCLCSCLFSSQFRSS